MLISHFGSEGIGSSLCRGWRLVFGAGSWARVDRTVVGVVVNGESYPVREVADVRGDLRLGEVRSVTERDVENVGDELACDVRSFFPRATRERERERARVFPRGGGKKKKEEEEEEEEGFVWKV